MDHFGDQKEPRYYDGALGGAIGWTDSKLMEIRMNKGQKRGEIDEEAIITSLARDKNENITESIKVVAHSMGGAYAKGLIKAIVEYAKAHLERCNGLRITEYDFANFQQNKQEAIEGVPLFQFDNKGDNVVDGRVGKMNGSKHQKQKGATGYEDNVNPDGGHSIFDYADAIKNLEEGKYEFKNGKFEKVN
jgi:hypothetical protein